MIPIKTRRQELFAFGLTLSAFTLLFTLWPQLDLWLAGLFWRDGRFPGADLPVVAAVYRGVPWAGGLIVAWCVFVLAKSLVPRHRPPVPRVRRAAIMLLVTALGVGLLVHAGLKDQWGRPRPGQVTVFQGPHEFQPVLGLSQLCPRNCSFVSGHAAGGFALLALGALGTRRTRWRWWWAGAVAGTAIGIVRMAQGGHFASDIAFALLAVWGTAIAVRWLWVIAAARRRRRLRAPPQTVSAGRSA